MSATEVEICAVLAAADGAGPYVLTLARRHGAQGHMFSLPCAPFDPTRGQSFEGRLRDWASVHTTAQITRITQIGTSLAGGRIRIGLLALVSDRNAFMPRGARWTPMGEIFPWEDWQAGEPDSLKQVLRPALDEWAQSGGAKQNLLRLAKLQTLFTDNTKAWVPSLTSERFDMLYEAGLLPEALRDRTGAAISVRQRHAAVYGQIMQGADRHALAMALSSLRMQVELSAAMSSLMPSPFTLGALQKTVEAVIGLSLHTQNFRRDLMHSGQISKTGERGRIGRSRPGMLWEWAGAAQKFTALVGMPLPRKAL